MKEKIKNQLKTKFPELKEHELNFVSSIFALQVAKEEDIKPLIEKITKEQITASLKDLSTHIETSVKAAETNKENELKEKFDFVEKNQPPIENPKENEVKDLEKIKSIIGEMLSPITEKLSSFETKDIQQKRLARLDAILKDCKDENFSKDLKDYFGNMSFQDDAAFETFITKQTEKITEVNQRYNENRMQMGSPIFNSRAEDGVSQAVKDYLETQNNENDPCTGKKL